MSSHAFILRTDMMVIFVCGDISKKCFPQKHCAPFSPFEGFPLRNPSYVFVRVLDFAFLMSVAVASLERSWLVAVSTTGVVLFFLDDSLTSRPSCRFTHPLYSYYYYYFFSTTYCIQVKHFCWELIIYFYPFLSSIG